MKFKVGDHVISTYSDELVPWAKGIRGVVERIQSITEIWVTPQNLSHQFLYDSKYLLIDKDYYFNESFEGYLQDV